jgi:predicted alpha-1,2-mannosidase
MKLALVTIAGTMLGLILFLTGCQTGDSVPEKVIGTEELTQFVDPFIGTGGHGHTFPGATTPFGAVQLSPDTDNNGWDWCSGYYTTDNSIMGFSHTHLSGTGASDLGDVLVMPTRGEIKYHAGEKSNPDSGWRSRFSHDAEGAEPGYYWVQLLDYGIKAELTATANAGFHRYSFPETAQAHITFDLFHKIAGSDVKDSEIKILDNSTIAGYRSTAGWAPLRFVYFVAKFSKEFISSRIYNYVRDGETISQDHIKAQKIKGGMGCVVSFETKNNEAILVKVGISSVSYEAAERSLNAEIPGWDFDEIRKQSKALWNQELNKIRITGTPKIKEIFYTALYHTMIAPNEIADDQGYYIGPDHRVRKSNPNVFYSTFSLWDTYRAAHPLFTLIQQDRVPGMINSMLESFKGNQFLPLWTLWGDETNCMIGNHSVPVIVDAFLKGIGGFDAETAYAAIKTSLSNDHFFSPWTLYDRTGYLPVDKEEQSVSRTLEFCYDDWCAAQMAKALGKTDDYGFFLNRSRYYRNLFDKRTGFFRGKNNDGSWKTPFNPYAIDWSSYTEATAWQYTWYVPQNVPDMIALMGGKELFSARLDSLFKVTSEIEGEQLDISGMIGQYAHGNEPSHHIAYLFNYARQPWKTQSYVREILATQYNNTPDGLAGNEDCGQMSAWYVFSALGFYPVNPCGGIYAIGSPVIDTARIQLGTGKIFTITTKNQSEQNRYIQSAALDGEPYNNSWISHKDILSGRTLVLVMGDTPNILWANTAVSVPPQME